MHTAPKPALSDSLNKNFRQRLFGCLADLTSQTTLVKGASLLALLFRILWISRRHLTRPGTFRCGREALETTRNRVGWQDMALESLRHRSSD